MLAGELLKLANQPLPYETEVAVFCDVTEVVMKINSFSVCYENHKQILSKFIELKILIFDKKE